MQFVPLLPALFTAQVTDIWQSAQQCLVCLLTFLWSPSALNTKLRLSLHLFPRLIKGYKTGNGREGHTHMYIHQWIGKEVCGKIVAQFDFEMS